MLCFFLLAGLKHVAQSGIQDIFVDYSETVPINFNIIILKGLAVATIKDGLSQYYVP